MTRERKIKDNGGFTLLEIMVVVGLLTFIMSAIFGILASARRTWATGEALISLQQEGRLGLDKMVRELRLCPFATVSADNRTVRFNIPIDADGDGFIDLSGAGSVIYGADDHQGWMIEYQIDTVNRQVIRRVWDENNVQVSQRILAKNINPDPLLTYFQTGTGGTVNIGLGIEIGAMEGLTLNPPLEIALRTQVNLRN